MEPGAKLPRPPSAWMTTSQFQPYRAGCETRPVRLAPNTTAATTAVTAAMDPSSADRAGTGLRPEPGSTARRMPSTAAAGSPAAAAFLAMTDDRAAAAPRGRRTDRAA